MTDEFKLLDAFVSADLSACEQFCVQNPDCQAIEYNSYCQGINRDTNDCPYPPGTYHCNLLRNMDHFLSDVYKVDVHFFGDPIPNIWNVFVNSRSVYCRPDSGTLFDIDKNFL